MEQQEKRMKILWAVDAFDDLPKIREEIARVLRGFARKARLEIDPVYVLSPEQLQLGVEFSDHWRDRYVPAAGRALEGQLQGVDLPGLKAPRTLTHHRASLKGAVEVLAGFAAVQRYDLIVVGSHGRRGLSRLLLGSFAEELLLTSRTPVLIVGGQTESRPEAEPMKILMPSDLSSPQSFFFREAFSLAETLAARTTLLHVIPRPVEAVFQSGVYLLTGGWVTVPAYLDFERRKQKDAAQAVLHLAEKQHVPCELMVDEATGAVVESILRHARESGASLIAMAAESGALATTVIGSITRQVARNAPCPVWIYRSPAESV